MKLYVTRNKLENVIRSSNGRMFTVNFTKKNGEERTLNGRIAVKKGTNGGKNYADRPDLPYVTVWEAPKPNTHIEGGFKNVNLNTVSKIKTDGVEFTVR